jgi:hypothetical protein
LAAVATTAAAQPLTWLGGDPYAGDPPFFTRGTHMLPWIGDIPSAGGLGDPANTVLSIDLNERLHTLAGEQVRITGIAWECNIRTSEFSPLDDAAVLLEAWTGVAHEGLVLTPGFGQNEPGSAPFASDGLLDLSDNGLPDFTLPDGILHLRFFERTVDQPGLTEALWDLRLGLALDYYPGPAPPALSALALSGAIVSRRRRPTTPPPP